MDRQKALEVLREEFPEHEIELQDTGDMELGGLLQVNTPDGPPIPQQLSLDILRVVDREGLTEDQARDVLVNWMEQSL